MIQNLKQKRSWISYQKKKKKKEEENLNISDRKKIKNKKKKKRKEKSFTIAFYEVSYFEIIV